MIRLCTGEDAGCSHSFPTGSAVGLYPSAEESGFLTSSAKSTGPQSLSMFVEDRPSSGAAEVVQNLLSLDHGLENGLVWAEHHWRQWDHEGCLGGWDLATWLGATEGISYCSLVPNLQYPWPWNLAEGDLWLERYWEPGVWVMTAAGDYIGGTLEF